MPVEVRNGRTQFRLRLVDGETEVKSLMVKGDIPPAGASVTHEEKSWSVSAPVWVLEGKKLFQVVTLTLKAPGKPATKRKSPVPK